MRRVQAAALDLVEARGYDAVTIEEIAAAADSSPASVYRNFGSKERILLWDDYDPMLLEGIAHRLASAPPLDAVRDALVEALDRIYDEDRARILRRSRLTTTHPALIAAGAADQLALARAIADVLAAARPKQDRLIADVLAGAIVGVLVAALTHWAAGGGRVPLRELLRKAFGGLRRALA